MATKKVSAVKVFFLRIWKFLTPFIKSTTIKFCKAYLERKGYQVLKKINK